MTVTAKRGRPSNAERALRVLDDKATTIEKRVSKYLTSTSPDPVDAAKLLTEVESLATQARSLDGYKDHPATSVLSAAKNALFGVFQPRETGSVDPAIVERIRAIAGERRAVVERIAELDQEEQALYIDLGRATAASEVG